MKIKTLKSMGFDGTHTPAGTIVECPNSLARDLIASNRAVAVEDETPAEVETETEGLKPFPPQEDESEGTEPEPTAKPKGKGK